MNTDVAEAATASDSPANPMRVWRVEVRPAKAEDDPLGRSVADEAAEIGLRRPTAVRSAKVYLIQAAVDQSVIERVAAGLLADPITQRWRLGAEPRDDGVPMVEIHCLPGVMDPVAGSTEEAIADMLGDSAPGVRVRTAARYDLEGLGADDALQIAERLLANTVIHSVHDAPQWPQRFTDTEPYRLRLGHVSIRDLDDEALQNLSRQSHLFLSLEEMRAIRDYYRSAQREPTDVELETLAQTWSEHCVHKTLKSTVSYRESVKAEPSAEDFAQRAGHHLEPDGTLVVQNLLKSTIAAATHELITDGVDWCLSVFVDNAGIVRFDETDAVTFKVETHKHPSATGIGGCIRDTMGTGLAARPIANTDIFAVAPPDLPFESLPKGVLHPRRILKQVVAGVRDYGNRMGIPTVNGAVVFDERYLGNPLVFAGSVGLIPVDKTSGEPAAGDRIIAIGGRTGRDGIHGATFSSAELTDTHADEFSHAVQIGNAITEKKALDVILQARDHPGGCLFSAITDCGAGGFSSAVGEMGEKLGAAVDLDKAPLKYDGLSYTEIWISEAQERMVLAVPPQNVEALMNLCAAEDVEAADLGVFGTEGAELILRYQQQEVGRLSMAFLHEGIPTPTRRAEWSSPSRPQAAGQAGQVPEPDEALMRLLGHPNIASKHWVIRQYDHEVQGGSVVKPLVGPMADGPSDAAVVRPKLDSQKAVALSCGLATPLGDEDPYWMALAAMDEAVRNAVCVGARPDRIAILDNFCWANCDKPQNLGALVRAAEACYDGAMAYRTPFISGKDSLNNEFKTEDGRTIAIPPTLLISAIGHVEDVGRCVTMDAKASGNLLIQVGLTGPEMGATHWSLIGGTAGGPIGRVDLSTAPKQLRAVAQLIDRGLVRSAHDCSEGGLLVAAAEMAFAGRIGLEMNLGGVPRHKPLDTTAICFAETPSRVLLEVDSGQFDAVARSLAEQDVPFGQVGRFTEGDRFVVQTEEGQPLIDRSIEELWQAWRQPLDW